MSKKTKKIVKRIAITYNPKALLVEFQKSEHENSLFHKKLTFRKIDKRMDHETLASVLIEKYPELFETVPRKSIEKILKRLIRGNVDVLDARNQEECSEGDLNKVSEEKLIQAKKSMDEVYGINKVSPSDERYQYDRRVDYYPESDSSWD
mmetsp:Transcript_3306/g.6185  ORF Transcript_3306/g.6185 Transcript_3306/m.6185 type:complete len:150 (+) Transcript_3306:2792-3241(+)